MSAVKDKRFYIGGKVVDLDTDLDDWTEYEAHGEGYVPVDKWGKDHWSTFAYLETRTVDGGGVVDNRRMRVNPRIHRSFAESGLFSAHFNGKEYPTILKGGDTLSNHDDFSCLEDMVAVGYVRAFYAGKRHPCVEQEIFGGYKCRVELTDKGADIAAQLRRHKANGGRFADFAPQEGGNE